MEGGAVDAVLLALARVERRDLRRLRAGLSHFLHPGLDLLATLRKGAADLGSDAADLGGASVDFAPLDPEPLHQLLAQLCLVEVASGLAPGVEQPRVEGRPL